MSNMLSVKNKWNDMVVCRRIVAESEQWVRLVMYKGRRTEAQDTVCCCCFIGCNLQVLFVNKGIKLTECLKKLLISLLSISKYKV